MFIKQKLYFTISHIFYEVNKNEIFHEKSCKLKTLKLVNCA